ncbi:hypothetical protein pdam_00000580 [Pocillopora damicornis]|uniref:Uncharacterized protein n=1 Tax=Pocillopora damicornis TaxID=46731 RepID=A0A3M6TY75_POCDA|nr:hypothetical protein pdam_00000580 [Pocillopora damicornis]
MDNSDSKASLKQQKSPETTTDTRGMKYFRLQQVLQQHKRCDWRWLPLIRQMFSVFQQFLLTGAQTDVLELLMHVRGF